MLEGTFDVRLIFVSKVYKNHYYFNFLLELPNVLNLLLLSSFRLVTLEEMFLLKSA